MWTSLRSNGSMDTPRGVEKGGAGTNFFFWSCPGSPFLPRRPIGGIFRVCRKPPEFRWTRFASATGKKAVEFPSGRIGCLFDRGVDCRLMPEC